MALLIALLVFCSLMTLVVGVWWATESRRRLRERLEVSSPQAGPQGILREGPESAATGLVAALLGGTRAWRRLETLVVQAGYRQRVGDFALIVLTFALVGGALAALRTGSLAWGVLAAPVAAALPVAYLLRKRQQRIRLFETQFPEALDMIGRAIRAGNALSGAIRLVGEEMPDPIGEEFKQVSEEVRLGVDPGEALSRLQSRVPVPDITFFCTAIRIQRGAGGNLAEVLDRLAEVIRERFKVLSYARVLQAQHKWSAIMVGLSPVIIGLAFQLMNPDYFTAMLNDPLGPYLIGAGLVFEVVGFFTIWRIAQIKV
jgi:tight adherence protein B